MIDLTYDKIPITQLGPDYYDAVTPAQFNDKKLRYINRPLLQNYNWSFLSDQPEYLWHFQSLPNNLVQPLALRYHGHQFRHYNPDLGDGRGFLYAQLLHKTQNASTSPAQWFDLGTKGSGTTPYSRQGDGRLTLKGAVREALATEYLKSFGVFTSETVSIFETGEKLTRYDEPSPTRSAVLTRCSRGHIRIGTFQRYLYLNKIDLLKKLTKYSLFFYYQDECQNLDWDNTEQVVSRLYQCVSDRLAMACAQIMLTGFVHGVLNSDNINITGEIFDFGPYRFLPYYDVHFTAAYFDQAGLYSYGRQPESYFWNLQRWTDCLRPLAPDLPWSLMLENFEEQFNDHLIDLFQKRLNLRFKNDDDARNALSLVFKYLDETQKPFEELFYNLHSSRRSILKTTKELAAIDALLESASILDPEQNHNIYYQQDQPQTLLIDEIESIWTPIAEHDDWSLFNKKIKGLQMKPPVY